MGTQAKLLSRSSSNDEEARKMILEQSVEAFVQLNCIIPTNEFLRLLKSHGVPSEITQDGFANEVLKLTMVKEYMGKRMKPKQFLSSYNKEFKSDSPFCLATTYKDTLPHRRLIDQQLPTNKPPTRGQR